ncbi:MAG: hypothetical protein HOO06_09545 [Bdellovibrionaceae bacterium]|jgi:hypothetical protein|nr:hypothetical protein [Pseudobdellovibrionaceae bacterium]
MDSIQLLSQQITILDAKTTRIENKIDMSMPLILEARKIVALEKRIDTVDKKADEGVKMKWQLMGGFAVVAILIQFTFLYLRKF